MKYLRLNLLLATLSLVLFSTLNSNQTTFASNQSDLIGAAHQALLIANDPGTSDAFGWSVAISGNRAVVGAPNEDPDFGGGPVSDAGAVYVFVKDGFTWVQEAKLTADDPDANDLFGIDVDIDGNTIVIGAVGEDPNTTDNAGAAYVFKRLGGVWYQQAKLVASDFDEEDSFGTSVAIDGFTIVVGAPDHDDGVFVDMGAAYIFQQNGSQWDQQIKLGPVIPSFSHLFGTSVAIDSRRVVVGATMVNPLGSGTGTAYVFDGNRNWKFEAQLIAEDGRSGDNFGNEVAISGDTAVVGARFADPSDGRNRITNAGAAYVFSPADVGWEQRAVLTSDNAAAFEHFGHSVSIDGGRILIGANSSTRDNVLRAGQAYLFSGRLDSWTQQTRVFAEYAIRDDAFGQAVALQGNNMLVGANGRSTDLFVDAGEVYVYGLASVLLPATGFAPDTITDLPIQPVENEYTAVTGITLEIPSLNVSLPISSVPKIGEGWDVRWLEGQAGYLEGTAFPTWAGNTGIAAHVTLSNGGDGPFAELEKLIWGERFSIHAWGQEYVYEVRSNGRVSPTSSGVLAEEDYDWVTLITCEGFDESLGEYEWRTVVRAVLVEVK
ncbi:MAG: sortase [Chloroflexi bacterium]|nr:MAG: sortase [Chloroflexota bacterium]